MKKNVIFAAILSALMFASCGGADKNGWYSDFDAAKKAAQSKNKGILLFVNSDNDVSDSSKGVQAVLSKNFTDAVKDRYICIHFDFTNLREVMGDAYAEISSKEQKAVEKRRAVLQKQFFVADTYGIQETPVLNVLTKEGYFVSEVTCEYNSDSSEGYAGNVALIDSELAAFNAKVAATKKGSASDKIAAIDEIFEETAEVHRIALFDLMKKAVALDSKNKSGKIGKYLFQMANIEGYKRVLNHDMAGAVKVYEKYASNKYIDPVDAQSLYFYCSRFTSRIQGAKGQDILKYLEKAIAAAPESEYVGQLQEYADYYKNTVIPAEKATSEAASAADEQPAGADRETVSADEDIEIAAE